MSSHTELLKRLLPPGAYDLNGPVLSAELTAEGNALDIAQASADQMLREMHPQTAQALLPEWESEYGITSVANSIQLSLEQRRVQVYTKKTMKGGQSRPWFIKAAERFGFNGATITEFKNATCNSNCNSALYSESDLSVWRMNMPLVGGQFSATCNSNCNSALGSAGTDAVESYIKQFKPADTVVMFAYA